VGAVFAATGGLLALLLREPAPQPGAAASTAHPGWNSGGTSSLPPTRSCTVVHGCPAPTWNGTRMPLR